MINTDLKRETMIRTIKIFSVIFTFMLFLNSCGDDDSSTETQEEPTPPNKVESAFIYGYRSFTPQGSVYYIQAVEEIPEVADPSEAVELGLNSRIYSFGEHPYTWNGGASTITKWDVDSITLELSVGGLLSFATTSIAGKGNPFPPLFLSETRAFFTNLAEGQVIEWNPGTMEITTEYAVDPLPDLGMDVRVYTEAFKYLSSDGKIIMPILFTTPTTCCDIPTRGARLAVFDPGTGSIDYQIDDRLFAGEAFLRQDGEFLYNIPPIDNSYIFPYYDVDTETFPSPFGIARFNSDGTLDTNFYFDLSEAIPITFSQNIFFINDDKIAINYVATEDYEWPEAFEERTAILGNADVNFQSVLIDINTREVTPFEAFQNYRGAFLANIIDGTNYYSTTSVDRTFSDLVRQDGPSEFTVLSTIATGQFQLIGKLW